MAIPLFTIGKDRSTTVGTSSAEVMPANPDRFFARLTNDSTEPIYLMLHEEAKLNYGIRLEKATHPNNFWEINNTNRYIGSINAICTSGDKKLLIVENTNQPSSSSSSSSFSSSSSSFSSSSSSSSSLSSSSSSSFSSSSSSFSSSSSSFSSSSSSSSFSSSSSSSSFSSSSSSSSSSFSSSSSSSSFSSSSSSSSFSSSSSSSSFSSSSSSSGHCEAGTRREYYITGDDADSAIHDNNWRAQSFTPAATHTITCVCLKLAREGSTAKTLTVEIQGVNGNGDPDGASVATGNLATSGLSGTADWYSIDLGVGAELTQDTQYTIVVKQDGVYADRVYWRYDLTGATYAGGVYIMTDDGGTTWTQNSDADFMFEEYSA